MNREQSKTSGEMEKTADFQTKSQDLKPPQREASQSNHSEMPSPSASELDSTGLDDRVQAHLGRLLRARYQELLDAPIPDKLRLQLDALSKREQKS